ncbi:MAG: zinc metalloprotease HtpX [Candidatus Woesearchaeota archaeon]
MANMYNEISKNKWNSYILIVFFVLIVSAIGYFLGYYWGSPYFGFGLAFFIAVIYTAITFSSGDKMILSSTGARELKRSEYPFLWHTIDGLAIAAGIPKPKAYVIDSPALNAFATGKSPKSASITVTTGLLEKMNRQELEGVIAHEMSHIKNYDIRFMMFTVALVGVVVLLSHIFLRSLWFGGHSGRKDSGGANIVFIIIGLVLVILSPILVQLIRLAISRKREYLADASGAMLTRYPEGLASALEKIKEDPKSKIEKASKGNAALFISNPLKKEKKSDSSWWSTHPPLTNRIQRLRNM